MSGFLHKLSAPTPHDTHSTFKLRFFLLDQHANLFLFKSNTNPNAIPVTFLPVSNCTSSMTNSMETGEPMFLLKAQGTGLGPDGSVVSRTWTIRFPEQDTLLVWIRSLQRGIQEKQRQQQQQHPIPSVAHHAHAGQMYHTPPPTTQRTSFEPPRFLEARSNSRAATAERSRGVPEQYHGAKMGGFDEQREALLRKSKEAEYAAMDRQWVLNRDKAKEEEKRMREEASATAAKMKASLGL
ncbi:hypothetical protein HDU98_011556 [Podochytrium sp. JEL0797]|nr:hypothetical protein HDU98_011556 [Podochytrium sp. JEL0797]